jgi:hypothetical protein
MDAVKLECDEEDEESDEDMGFGLFDGDTPPQSPQLQASRKQSLRSVGTMERKANAHFDVERRSAPANPVSTIDEGTLLQRLIKKQSFEGSWSNDDLPCNPMGIVPHSASVIIEKIVAAHPELKREDVGKVVATALAVTYLEKKMASEEETWELIVEKARDWLGEAIEESIMEEVWKEVEKLVAA